MLVLGLVFSSVNIAGFPRGFAFVVGGIEG